MATDAGKHRAAPLFEARRSLGTAGRAALDHMLRPLRSAEAKAHRLHALEREGETGLTPLIALLGLVSFLVPVFIVILGVAFAAYFLA